jgi:hypothetical protein
MCRALYRAEAIRPVPLVFGDSLWSQSGMLRDLAPGKGANEPIADWRLATVNQPAAQLLRPWLQRWLDSPVPVTGKACQKRWSVRETSVTRREQGGSV